MRYCILLMLLPLMVKAKDLSFPPRPTVPKLTRLRDYNQAKSINNNYVVYDFIALVNQHRYPAEEHEVTTRDGYKITFHRIPGSPKCPKTKGKPVIFIQHGIISSSDSWVLMGPKKDLAFLAADVGFDVWIGNVRGNSYAREHVYLSADRDPEFWKFSYHEIAMYDIPAMIDYILRLTNQKSLTYIGHSQGTTVSYALLSMKPEYNKKFNLIISLSPVTVWVKDLPPIANIVVEQVEVIKDTFEKMRWYEILPQSPLNVFIGNQVCQDQNPLQPICLLAIFQAFGISPYQTNSTALPTILKYNPAGTTMQSFHHYYQNIHEKGVFRAYNYGNAQKNFQIYNQTTPPIYNLKNVVAPAALFYGKADILSNKEEAMALKNRLTNVVVVEEVPEATFNHLDFLFGKDAKQLIYDRVIELATKYSSIPPSIYNQNLVNHQSKSKLPHIPWSQKPKYKLPKPQLPWIQQPKYHVPWSQQSKSHVPWSQQSKSQ